MIPPNELIVDNFAGGGGASEAIEEALGRPVDIAINHDREAISMHAANHPNTRHLCEDVWAVDIVAVTEGRPVGLAWFSPDCKHFSKAKGGKPVEKKIRGLAWVALKWARLKKPRIIILENVEEFQTWGPVIAGKPCPRRKGMTFKRWVTQLRNLGYRVEWRELRACDYGAPTIRKRLFVVARCDGQAIEWPAKTHGAGLLPYRTAAECIDWSLPCPSIFLTRKEGRAIGVNRPLAEATMRRIARGVKRYVIDAAEPFIVNLTHHGSGQTQEAGAPLRTVTGANRGEKALVVPTLVQTGYGERAGQAPRNPGLDKPLGTAVAGGVKHALVSTFLSTYYGDKRPSDVRGSAMDEPVRTQGVENRHAVVATFLAQHNGGRVGRAAEEPLSTVTMRGANQAVVSAFLSRQFSKSVGSQADEPAGTTTAGGGGKSALVTAFLTEHANASDPRSHSADEPLRTQCANVKRGHHAVVTSHIMKMRGSNVGSGADEPLHTISAKGTHHAGVRAFLLKYFGTDQDPRLEEPMHTVTSKHRFGLVMVHGEPYEIVDIGMRMLTPRELFRAQGFREDYIIEGGRDVSSTQGFLPGAEWVELTKTAQVRMCGNSVSPPPAAALVRAQFGEHKVGAAA